MCCAWHVGGLCGLVKRAVIDGNMKSRDFVVSTFGLSVGHEFAPEMSHPRGHCGIGAPGATNVAVLQHGKRYSYFRGAILCRTYCVYEGSG